MIEDAIRWIFWALAKLLLSAADWIYEILNTVIGIDLSGDTLRYTWLFMLCFTSFACLIRVTCIVLKQSADDEKTNIDFSKLFKRIVAVFVTIAVSYTTFAFVLGVPKTVIDIYNSTMSYDERLIPSSAVISATSKTAISAVLGDMTSTDEVIGIDTIDSQLNTKEDDRYIYFFGYAELFLCIIGAAAVLCMQLNIVVDVTMRLFLNVFRFVIGFIPISSLVEDNSTCGDWIKDIISDTLVMCFSLIFTQMVFGFMTTEAITSLNGIVRIVVFTLGLMAVSKSSELIAKYMGASNLSSGKMGNAVMAMGALAALHGAGKIAGGIAKNSFKGVSTMGNAAMNEFMYQSYKNSNSFNSAETGFASPMNNNGSFGEGIQPSLNGATNNNYFVGNNTYQDGADMSSLNQNNDESILDKSPTTSYDNLDSRGDVNNSLALTSDKPHAVSTDVAKEPLNIFGNNQPGIPDDKFLSRRQYKDLLNQGYSHKDIREGKWHKDRYGIDYQNYNGNDRDFYAIRGENFENDLKNKNNGYYTRARGTSFVDTPSSGHSFKNSNGVYGKSAKYKYSDIRSTVEQRGDDDENN